MYESIEYNSIFKLFILNFYYFSLKKKNSSFNFNLLF
jgi:hypothetical protein